MIEISRKCWKKSTTKFISLASVIEIYVEDFSSVIGVDKELATLTPLNAIFPKKLLNNTKLK